MRKHYYLIVDHPDGELEGRVEILNKRRDPSSKNNRTTVHMRDLDTNETWSYDSVSMGYVDYDDQEEYEAQCADDANEKLAEIDDQHMVDAGINPEEIRAQ